MNINTELTYRVLRYTFNKIVLADETLSHWKEIEGSYFSQQYQCNINQISDEKKENQFRDNLLIQYQILQTNIMRIVWLTVRRTKNLILEFKG